MEMFSGARIKDLLDGVLLASIGPVTSDTLVRNGYRASVEAEEYTVDGLIRALVDHYRSGKNTA
jgi:uroporphyrinogen III methyltransferase/synthase